MNFLYDKQYINVRKYNQRLYSMENPESRIDLDTILSVLENPTRRKILKKLSTDTNYPLQLSRELGVSQQAIMKHLKVLENAGFVTVNEEKSDKGGPPRKIYVPRRRFSIRIDIGPNTYDEKIYTYSGYGERDDEGTNVSSYTETRIVVGGLITGEMKEQITGALPAFTDKKLENFRMRMEKAVRVEEKEHSLSKLKDLIDDINKEINALETKRKKILELRERVFKEVNKLIGDIAEDYVEKEIYSMFIKDSVDDIELLSDLLNIRKKMVLEILKNLESFNH